MCCGGRIRHPWGDVEDDERAGRCLGFVRRGACVMPGMLCGCFPHGLQMREGNFLGSEGRTPRRLSFPGLVPRRKTSLRRVLGLL